MRSQNPVAFMCRTGTLFACVLLLAVAACSSPEERAQSHYQRGVELLESGEVTKARLEFRNALQLKDDFVAAWHGLAQVEERRGNWEKVVGLLRRVVELDPNHVEAQVKLGTVMLLAGEFKQAREILRALDKIKPEDAKVLALKASVLYKLEDRAGAVAAAKKALVVDPENVEATLVLAADRLAEGDAAGALAHLQRSLENNEGDISLQLFKINVLGSLNDNKEAEAVFAKLIDLYPKNRAFRLALARFHLSKNEPQAAERVVRAMGAAFPDDLDANLDVVRFLNTTKGLDAARAELERLVETQPENFEYKLALVEFSARHDDRTGAEALLNNILRNTNSAEQKIIVLNRLARLKLTDGDISQAKEYVRLALAEDEGNVDALITHATIKLGGKRYEDAIADLRTALKERPDSIGVLLLLARAHEGNGSADLAEERLAIAFNTSKFNAEVGLAYKDFLFQRKRYRRAEEVLKRVLQGDPKNLDVLKGLAQVQLVLNNWVGAEETAELIDKLGDEEGFSREVQGLALAGQQKFEESLRVFRGAYNAAPSAVRPLASLVQAYVRAGKHSEAEEFLKSLLASNKANAQAHVLLGQLYTVSDRTDEARAAFDQAVKHNPKNDIGYRALASMLIQREEYHQARTVLATAQKKLPDSLTVRLTSASLYEITGDIESAIKEYEELHKKRPNSPVVANNLASLLAEHRTDEASLERAFVLAEPLRASPVPEFKDTLGWILYRKGDIDGAVSLLREAVTELPNVAAVRYHIGMGYLASNKCELAARELKKAIELAEGQQFRQKNHAAEMIKLIASSPDDPTTTGQDCKTAVEGRS